MTVKPHRSGLAKWERRTHPKNPPHGQFRRVCESKDFTTSWYDNPSDATVAMREHEAVQTTKDGPPRQIEWPSCVSCGKPDARRRIILVEGDTILVDQPLCKKCTDVQWMR